MFCVNCRHDSTVVRCAAWQSICCIQNQVIVGIKFHIIIEKKFCEYDTLPWIVETMTEVEGMSNSRDKKSGTSSTNNQPTKTEIKTVKWAIWNVKCWKLINLVDNSTAFIIKMTEHHTFDLPSHNQINSFRSLSPCLCVFVCLQQFQFYLLVGW